ncbi:MAG: hypothetical protein C0622_04110 [Desulfuromonas sp.]|nr:MAG: hypothetical protein C0622_04110 [Desulfuromonas sp.]
MRFVGTFLGKNIYTYDPKIKCSKTDLSVLISDFSRTESLRQICFFSKQLFDKPKENLKFRGVPLREEILHYLALTIIENCRDDNQRHLNDVALEKALKMCHYLVDNRYDTNPEQAINTLIEISYNQFIFQQKNYNNFSRNYYIYTSLWNKLDHNDICILNEIESEIGIPYNYAIIFAFALLGNRHGHFWEYGKKEIADINYRTGLSLTTEHHRKFISYCCGSYDEITSQDKKIPTFIRFPIINTKISPIKNKGNVYLIISQQFVHDKLTTGLYFNLSSRFNEGGKRNKFKEHFGHVFQNYVGEILNFHLNGWEIVLEFKYKKKNGHQDTVDWFAKQGDKLILIEVKQSSIFIESKYSPSNKSIEQDLKKTIIHAVKQLETTKEDITKRQYKELIKFEGIKKFAKLIIINDPLYNSNFLIKSIFNNEIKYKDFQIININDLEYLLSHKNVHDYFFDVIYDKKENNNETDFNEYIYSTINDEACDKDFLQPIWDDFWGKISTIAPS